jgi:hypothetical protein
MRRVPARGTDYFAELAAQYIGATLGVQVEPWDRDGRQGVHDLRYEHQGRSVAVEVKCVLDGDFRQMQGRIDRQAYQPDERFSRLWIVSVRHGARITDVRRELPDLLVFLDEIGWDGRLWQLRREHPVVAARFQALGVLAVAHLPATEMHPPGYLLLLESWERWGEDDIEMPVSFASAYLAGDSREVIRLRRHLRQAQAEERHAFLFIGHEHTEGWPLMTAPGEGDKMALPTTPPTLPEPIDGLWLTGWSSFSRVIAWLPHAGWIAGTTG